jgi:hypothetical protein
MTTSGLDFVRLGARIERYDGTAECGLNVVKGLITRPRIVLNIQRQIVDEGKNLIETDAGRQLREDIAKSEQKHNEQIKNMS